METAVEIDNKEVILRLIKEDFKMICLHNRLDSIGFCGDFPNISYEIWDLLGIPHKEFDRLLDQYWQWAAASEKITEGQEAYMGWVYQQLAASVE